MDKNELKKLSNEAEWCDKDLLREYDEHKHDGRIKFKPIEDLEEYFRKRRDEKRAG